MTTRARCFAAAAIAVSVATGCRFAPAPDRVLAQADGLLRQNEKAATEDAVRKYSEVQAAWRIADTRRAARAGAGLGAAFEQLGLLDKSSAAYEDALRLAERSSDRLLESRLHSSVGVAQALAGGPAQALDEAEGHCEAALRIAQRLSSPPEEATARNCFGEVAYGRGTLAAALESFRQAAAAWQRVGDPRGLAKATLAQGWVHSDMGQFDLARRSFEDARSLWQSLRDGRQLAITLVAEARVRQRRGDYQDALEGFDGALALLEPVGDSVWLGATLTGKAQVLLNTADVTQALNVWERAFSLFQASGSKPAAVDALMSAGETQLASGDGLDAFNRFERALALATELGNVRLRAWALRSMGSAELFRKRAVEAQRHLQHALELLPLADDPRLEASIQADLGQALELLDEGERAWRHFEDALAASRLASDRYGAAKQLFARGVVEGRLGRFAQARASLKQALYEQQQLVGSSHPMVAKALVALAGVDFASGEFRDVLRNAMNAEETTRHYLRQTLRYLPERQALALAAERPGGLDLALSLAAAGAGVSPATLLDAVIQGRGLVLDELAARNLAANVSDPRARDAAVKVRLARQRYANLLVRTLQAPVERSLLEEAQRQAEEAERALAELSAGERTGMTRPSIGLETVRAALPDGAALVSFVQYSRRMRTVERGRVPQQAPVSSFAAFVVRAGREDVALVPLGSVAQIEPLISDWRAEVTTPAPVAASAPRADLSNLVAGRRLRAAVWDPLTRYLRGATRVFVVPDGALNLVSLAALPNGTATYVLETTPPIHYLSAEREVQSMGAPASGARGMLALGSPAFDDLALPAGQTPPGTTGTAQEAAGASPTRGVTQPCESLLRSLRFQPLEGTLQEVQEIASVWRGPAGAALGDARVLVGQQANESTFKQAAHDYRVLHLATHGFFLGSGCTVAAGGTRGVGGLSASGLVDNPLLISGLALAGANRRGAAGPDEDDGILTAEEVASMDLDGVEWAVLSACDTGVGEVRAGEGVFGLRRAFRVAGARTVIMSLWSVDDQATRQWMRALYEGRFQRQLFTADAVHAASLSLLRDRRAKGQSTRPFYWAAFVAAGDWR